MQLLQCQNLEHPPQCFSEQINVKREITFFFFFRITNSIEMQSFQKYCPSFVQIRFGNPATDSHTQNTCIREHELPHVSDVRVCMQHKNHILKSMFSMSLYVLCITLNSIHFVWIFSSCFRWFSIPHVGGSGAGAFSLLSQGEGGVQRGHVASSLSCKITNYIFDTTIQNVKVGPIRKK